MHNCTSGSTVGTLRVADVAVQREACSCTLVLVSSKPLRALLLSQPSTKCPVGNPAKEVDVLRVLMFL